MRKGSKKENYFVNHDYFKTWSHDMAYILGFLVADGNVAKNGYYVKVEVKPSDRDVLEFIRDQITPGYAIRQSRPSEIRWYPSSAILKKDLSELGVVPAKTGKEIIPPTLPDKYLWDFIRGVFDGDGTVDTTCVSVTSNSKKFLVDLMTRTGIGRLRKDRMNWKWEIEEKSSLTQFYNKLYSNGSFSLERKNKAMNFLLKSPDKTGHFSKEEDQYLFFNYSQQTRTEMAMALGRTGLAVKNRMRKLRIRKKEGVPFVA